MSSITHVYISNSNKNLLNLASQPKISLKDKSQIAIYREREAILSEIMRLGLIKKRQKAVVFPLCPRKSVGFKKLYLLDITSFIILQVRREICKLMGFIGSRRTAP